MKRNVSLVGAQRHCAPTFFLRRRVSRRRNAPWVYERLRPSRRMRARGPRTQEPGGEWRHRYLIVLHAREHIRSGPRYGRAAHARNPAVHAAPRHTNRMNIGCSWEDEALRNPPTGWGDGEIRFPHPPARGLRPHLPAGGGVGKPGFPTPPLQQPMFTLDMVSAGLCGMLPSPAEPPPP